MTGVPRGSAGRSRRLATARTASQEWTQRVLERAPASRTSRK